MSALLAAGSALYGRAWEARRAAYARGLLRPKRVPAKVVSIGNLTVGGTGKTTLTLHLARLAARRGHDVAVVCRRYRQGPGGLGDEEMLYAAALGKERVFAGTRKSELAAHAAAAGRRLLLVDDGFSHWRLERDLDLVLLDAWDPWGGGRMLPAGRLREPRRALQRASGVVWSQVERDQDPAPLIAEAKSAAPAARVAVGRHAVAGVRRLDGAECEASGRAVVVTGTGNPRSVARTVAEAGFQVTDLRAYPDHHWFDPEEARREEERARALGAQVALTAKDAVRWPLPPGDRVVVVQVRWEWVVGGEEVERLALGGVVEA